MTAARATRTTTCPACGNSFDPGKPSRAWSFCSPLCATAAALIALSNSEAVVDIRDHDVLCLLCKKSIRVAGTHFARVHGIVAGSPRRGATQVAFGLPQGSRVAPASYRAELVASLRKREARPPIPPSTRGRKLTPCRAPKSALQRATAKAIGESQRTPGAPRGERICEACGGQYQVRRGTVGRFCSRACSGKAQIKASTMRDCASCKRPFALKWATETRRVCGLRCEQQRRKQLGFDLSTVSHDQWRSMNNRQIAAMIGCSASTVSNHRPAEIKTPWERQRAFQSKCKRGHLLEDRGSRKVCRTCAARWAREARARKPRRI